MKKHESRKRLRALWRTLAVILVLVAAVPYLVPLSAHRAAAGPLPFENSAFEEVNGFSFHYRAYRPDDGLIRGSCCWFMAWPDRPTHLRPPRRA